LWYTARTMNADEKIIKALDDLRADMQKQGERLEVLQDDVTTIKAETAKIGSLR
jgi:hypothetical protein